MKKTIFIITALMFTVISRAQNAMQLTGPDCNGTNHNLFSDLDSGKAVVVFFFMDNCGSCPPPASKVQTMANNLMKKYPGKIKGYAMPFNNSTTCTATKNWVTNNNLLFYTPYDSGAVQVAFYGGFGMPTVVLLGGTDHRVMFSTQSFATSDTTIMRDSIRKLFGENIASIQHISKASTLKLYPNPAADYLAFEYQMTAGANVKIELIDSKGSVIKNQLVIAENSGKNRGELSLTDMPSGTYSIRLTADKSVENQNFVIIH